MSTSLLAIKATSISVSLIASGGIAALSLFDIPELKAQPASRSLPSIRWLFSRGSHIFPTTATISTIGFAYLAVSALPAGRGLAQMLRFNANGPKVNGYLAAAALNMAIAVYTAAMMVPTANFALIEFNERKGGARSEKSAQQGKYAASERTAEDSVNGKGDINEFTDLSGPQAKTELETTEEENRQAQELLTKFGQMNAVRAVFAGAGGIVGLVNALL